MKLEIIERSKQKAVETHFMPSLYMSSFQEWKGKDEVTINLDCLSHVVENINSKDPETKDPVSNPEEVVFNLPTHITNNVLDKLAKSQMASEESPDQFEEQLKKVTDKVSMPELKSITILSSIVTEILQNRCSHSEYEVRISDE